MKLHGRLEDNLSAAMRSARRLRGKPVHPDTLSFWADLLVHARAVRDEAPEPRPLDQFIAELELELAERTG